MGFEPHHQRIALLVQSVGPLRHAVLSFLFELHIKFRQLMTVINSEAFWIDVVQLGSVYLSPMKNVGEKFYVFLLPKQIPTQPSRRTLCRRSPPMVPLLESITPRLIAMETVVLIAHLAEVNHLVTIKHHIFLVLPRWFVYGI